MMPGHPSSHDRSKACATPRSPGSLDARLQFASFKSFQGRIPGRLADAVQAPERRSPWERAKGSVQSGGVCGEEHRHRHRGVRAFRLTPRRRPVNPASTPTAPTGGFRIIPAPALSPSREAGHCAMRPGPCACQRSGGAAGNCQGARRGVNQRAISHRRAKTGRVGTDRRHEIGNELGNIFAKRLTGLRGMGHPAPRGLTPGHRQ